MEHYSANCEKIILGYYTFSVSLKQSEQATSGKFILTAGQQIYVNDYTFSSFDQVIKLIHVKVSMGKRNTYVFEILDKINGTNETVPGNETNGTTPDNETETPD